VTPPPDSVASPIPSLAELLGWVAYLTVMGGGLPDLTLLTVQPAPLPLTQPVASDPEDEVPGAVAQRSPCADAPEYQLPTVEVRVLAPQPEQADFVGVGSF